MRQTAHLRCAHPVFPRGEGAASPLTFRADLSARAVLSACAGLSVCGGGGVSFLKLPPAVCAVGIGIARHDSFNPAAKAGFFLPVIPARAAGALFKFKLKLKSDHRKSTRRKTMLENTTKHSGGFVRKPRAARSQIVAALLAAAFCLSAPAAAREGINIVGSSTVYPFSTVAAERFSQITGKSAPKIESTGSGGGLKLFCKGEGDNTPDITNSSRRIKKSEQKLCAENGVADILEVKIGYDGIVVGQSIGGESFSLTQRQIFLGLARQVPDGNGGLQDNAHERWSDVDSSLPALPIEVYGPPPTSGTRDAFVELVMEEGCDSFAKLKAIKKTDKKRHKAVCTAMREDGAFIEAGENDNLIIQKLAASKGALGIFGFSFLDNNRDTVRGLQIGGVAPEFEAIADGSYPVSRPLYFYAKLSHFAAKPDLESFVRFFVSPEVMGDDGFLVERGLIPLPQAEYAGTANAVETHTPMAAL